MLQPRLGHATKPATAHPQRHRALRHRTRGT
jgi:hypothetical protein